MPSMILGTATTPAAKGATPTMGNPSRASPPGHSPRTTAVRCIHPALRCRAAVPSWQPHAARARTALRASTGTEPPPAKGAGEGEGVGASAAGQGFGAGATPPAPRGEDEAEAGGAEEIQLGDEGGEDPLGLRREMTPDSGKFKFLDPKQNPNLMMLVKAGEWLSKPSDDEEMADGVDKFLLVAIVIVLPLWTYAMWSKYIL